MKYPELISAKDFCCGEFMFASPSCLHGSKGVFGDAPLFTSRLPVAQMRHDRSHRKLMN